MELTEEQFAEIVGEPTGPVYDTAVDAADERRKYPRVGFGSRARIFPLIESAGGNGCAVLVRDISRGGVGFLFTYKLEVGDEFIIHIPRKDRPVIQIQCMTQRCDLGGTGGFSYVVGASFELVLDSMLSPAARPEAEGHTAGISQWPGAPEEVARESLVTSIYKRVSAISMFDRSSSRIRNRLKPSAAMVEEKAEEKSDKAEKSAEKVAAPAETAPAAAVAGAVTVVPFPIIEAAPIDPSRPRNSLFASSAATAAVIEVAPAVAAVVAAVEVVAAPVVAEPVALPAPVIEAKVEVAAVVEVIAPVIEPIAPTATLQVIAPVVVAQPVIEPVAAVVVAAVEPIAPIVVPVTPVVVAAVQPVAPVIVPPVQQVVLAPVVTKSPAPVVAAKKVPAVASQNEPAVVLPWEMDAPAKKGESAKGSNESLKPVAAGSTGDSRESLSVFVTPLTCRRVRRRR